MAQPVIQTSFNSGEWAPALNARVDLAKYHSGAALLRNFFVDYRGGATIRPGTKYIIQSRSTSTVRLIPFQASFTVSYVLEFGEVNGVGYVVFYNNSLPVLNAGLNITGVTQANPAVVSVTNSYVVGDVMFISNVAGMTQLNGNYYKVSARTAGTITLADLNGVAINSTGYGAWTSGGTTQSQYTIASPYKSIELSGLKFAQNVNTLTICHPNYPPYILTLNSATNWTLAPIVFAPTIGTPTGLSVTTTLAADVVDYAYVVTAVDSNGQESNTSAFAVLNGFKDIRVTSGTNTVTWSSVTGAVSYNVYRAEPRYNAAVPAGVTFGFVGNVTGTTFIDSNVSPDFSQGPPIVENPFAGSGVQSINVTVPGSYTPGVSNLPVPTVSFSGGGGSGAAATAFMKATSFTISTAGDGYTVGQVYNAGIQGVQIQCTSVGVAGSFTGGVIVNPGSISGTLTDNPVQLIGFGVSAYCLVTLTYGVASVGVTSPGIGYATPPTVAFSSGAAAATATLGTPSSGNPTVPGFAQQRLILAGPVSAPLQINGSSVGAYNNFNVHNPLEADDAFQGTLVSGQLNTIQSMISQPYGLIVLTDKGAWLINGGSNGSPITPLALVANAQAYNGASGVPPIVASNDILYVQSKGSIVRDLVFNYYTQVYTGADISILSSHLFYTFTLNEWAWAEEPFKVVWAVRNDGALLSLTFVKEQELIAWAHSDTQGLFQSIATVTEQVAFGSVDAIYVVVQRNINGNAVRYIERMTELYYPSGLTDAWCVDAGIQYNGAATLTFNGAQQLAGAIVTGLATDDQGNVTVITPFAMPTNQTGTFTLPAPPSPATGYTRVTLGLSYLPQLQTLAIDLGQPTAQGKRKKIAAVTVRCKDALGLSIGSTQANIVAMQDLILGNIGSATNLPVTNLVTGDARTIIDPDWTVPGQYFIQQNNPMPASILGVIPEIEVGDD